jgi:hypothetical protein
VFCNIKPWMDSSCWVGKASDTYILPVN